MKMTKEETAKINKLSSNIIEMKKMTREIIELVLISRATLNPQDIIKFNDAIINMMTDLSREISDLNKISK